MAHWLYCIAFCCLALPATARCVDPVSVSASVVNIVRTLDADERKAETGLVGISGTAWFVADREIVTVAHVSEAMRIGADWIELQIKEGVRSAAIPVRLRETVGSTSEKLAILQLRDRFQGAASLAVRGEALVSNEPVTALAYPGRRLRSATGRFVEISSAQHAPGAALFELFDGRDRMALDHGASGAPIIDCDGAVVAVVTNVFTQTLSFMARPIRISTAWGTPNVVAIPIRELVHSGRPKPSNAGARPQ